MAATGVMVGTILRLRWRVLGNTLSRQPWQLVGFCVGILWALTILGLAGAGVIALAVLQPLETGRTVVVIAGALLLLGWLIGPVLVAGMDTTVDAARLAPFPLTRRQIMAALTATGLTGIPGIVTALAALATVVLWMRWPLAAVAAVPCVVVAVLTCVVASRLMATVFESVGGNRRGRQILGSAVIVLLMLTGPILTGLMGIIGGAGNLLARAAGGAEVLAWTPIGAAWAVPSDLAAGHGLTALARFVLAAATLAVLWLLWDRALAASTVSPRRTAARTVKAGRLGLFGLMPTGGVGATWARSLTAWLRDPRYLRQLIIVPIFPVLFAFSGGLDGGLFGLSAFFVALTLAIGGYADISYDGTAFASVLSTGIRGRSDRLGRLLGAASVGVPLAVVIAVVTVLLSGAPQRLPAVLGGALGFLLAGYAVAAVSSALLVVPVASPDDSPFKTVPGQTFVNGLIVFAVLGAAIVLAAPALVLSIVSLVTGSALAGWLALLLALVCGVGEIVAGVLVGGRTLERTGPDLLMRIKAFPA